MATLHIRGLDDAVKQRLRIRAAEHGRSMEGEARAILEAVTRDPLAHEHLVTRVRSLVEKYGPLDMELPPREVADDPPDLR